MQEKCTGVLRWTPKEFFESELEDALIALDGLIRDNVREERIARKLGHYSIAPYAEKSFKILKDWPIALDDEIMGKERAEQKKTYEQNMYAYLKKKREAKALRILQEKQTEIVNPHS